MHAHPCTRLVAREAEIVYGHRYMCVRLVAREAKVSRSERLGLEARRTHLRT